MNTIQTFSTMIEENRQLSLLQVREIFANSSRDEFESFLNDVFSHDNRRVFDVFIYYLRIFRDSEQLYVYLNAEQTSVEFIEKFVYYTLGHFPFEERSGDRLADGIFSYLSQKKIMQLMLESKNLSRDYLMMFLPYDKAE